MDAGLLSSPGTSFPAGQTITSLATFEAGVGTQPLVLEVDRVDGPTARRVRRELVPLPDPGSNVLSRELVLSSFVPDPGLYELRYLRDGIELASGSLLVTP